ncbi:hypothetical protein [Streptomyces sp. LMG1-1-1.1]|uniref:hypothetical protein n=1 Tax=Streptomyces sp. LMG1-1-1.1 TaxID=3135245 RepID=UPI003465EA6C
MTNAVSDLYEALVDGYLARPEADQAPYYAVAEALRRFADSIWDDAGDANQHVQRLLSSGRGEAMDALGQHWDKVMNQDVASAAEAARAAGAVAYEIGDVIAVTKAQVIQIAAVCAEETVAALVAGVVTFGAAEGAVAAALAQARAQSRVTVEKCHRLVTSALERLQREPSVAGLAGVAAGLAGGLAGGVGGQARDGASDTETGRAWGNDLATGPGRTGAEGISVDHAEHERAAGRLREVATQVLGETAGLLAEAARQHTTAAASGELGAAIAGALDPVLRDLATCTTAFADHLNGALPDGILLISTGQQATDGDSRRRMSELDG